MIKLLIILLALPFTVHAETFIVGINETLIQNAPTIKDKITSTLNNTGLDLEYRILPAERVLLSLAKGDIAMATYRQPHAMKDFPHLIQIQPKVSKHELFLFTHPDHRSLCELESKAFAEHSIAGVLGTRLFPEFVYPNFKYHSTAMDIQAVVKMVSAKRADFGLWPIKYILKTESETGLDVHICDQAPYLVFNFYSYVHPKYAYAIPKIEAAYRKAFLP